MLYEKLFNERNNTRKHIHPEDIMWLVDSLVAIRAPKPFAINILIKSMLTKPHISIIDFGMINDT